MNYKDKLQEYISLLDFNDDYFARDYKNNLKFVKALIKKYERQNKKEELVKFLSDLIDIHKKTYLKEK